MKTKGFRIDAMANKGRFGARLSQQMLKNVEAYLACCQLGITMASLGLGWVGEPTVAAMLEPVLHPLGMPDQAVHVTAFVVGFLVFSSLHIVLGEQVPKTLAIRQPEPVAQWIAYPLHASFVVFYPLNWLLNTARGHGPAADRCQRGAAPGDPHRRRDRRTGGCLGRAWPGGGEPGGVHPEPLPTSSSSRSAT